MSNIGASTASQSNELPGSPDLSKGDLRINIPEETKPVKSKQIDILQADRYTPGRNDVYVSDQPPPPYHTREAPPAYESSSSSSSSRNRRVIVMSDDFEDPIHPGNSWMFEEPNLRFKFVRKVMAIVAVQFAIVCSIVAFAMFHEPTKRFMLRTWWLSLVFLIVFIVTLFILSCFPSTRRKVPGNYILLLIYTLSLGYICAAGSIMYSTNAILIAMGATFGICLLVVLLAFQSWLDITKLTPIMIIIVLIFMLFGFIFGILYAVTGNVIYDLIWAGLAVIFFTVMLLYDLQMILGGKKYEISPEEYIFGALTVFTDIMFIFMNLLTLIGRTQ
ncbi:protein lifeguard 1-like isoform X2 [Anthonomus grandis grandis]|uniref:protein lifeguard 1-like isoform X2 n=1 Tax=Anthonomus grandis grandis TaxID=2921223 RepID=UPI0021658CA2|nr:protein lifeguard 1-like isoform X2 [Anthonomus grandis grandis]